MKKSCLVIFFLVFFGLRLFGEPADQEEIDYLLFLPNSGNNFVNENQAGTQLDRTARYLKERDLVPGQVIIYGYAAFSNNDIDPMDISRQRALFVINELHKRGVSRNLFADPVGHGSVYLWGTNSTEEDKVPNRRVRILIDGTLITPEVIAAPNIADAMGDGKIIITEEIEEPEKQNAAKAAGEPFDFNFPWWILLPLLLVPLLFLLFRSLKNRKREEKPAAKKTPARENLSYEAPKPEPAPQFAAQQAPEPAPVPASHISEPAPQSAFAAPVFAAHVETTEEIVDLEEEIRRRAYFHSQGHDYCDMDSDWFVALPKVRVQFEEKGYKTYMENGTWWAKKTVVKK